MTETLYDRLVDEGIILAGSCGGRATCGLCRIKIDGKVSLACRTEWKEENPVKVETSGWRWKTLRASPFPADSIKVFEKLFENVGTAVEDRMLLLDIGTTNVLGILVETMKNKKKSCRAMSVLNAQIALGSDIITRLDFARTEEGKEKLLFLLNRSLEILMEALEIKPDCKPLITFVTGNPAMVAFFEKRDTGILRKNSIPTDMSKTRRLLKNTGRYFLDSTLLPAVGAFTGPDLFCGVIGSGISEEKGPALYLDLGTNGEMALGGKDFLLVSSASCGSAFELSGLFDDKNHESGELPLPLSMMEDAIVKARKEGKLDAKGRILRPDDVIDELPVIKVPFKGRYRFLSSDEIEDFIRARAALRAGIEIMLERAGVRIEDISRVVISGQVVKGMSPVEFMKCGLLPSSNLSEIEFLEFAPLKGLARLVADEDRSFSMMDELVRMTAVLEFSEAADYYDSFVKHSFIEV